MPQTIEQVLAQNGRGFFQTSGDSMEPLLHNRQSTVVLEKLSGPVRRGDVVLYRRPAGEYVLHRVVKVLDGVCLIRGDNRLHAERVPEDWILGRMTGFFPDAGTQYIDCGSAVYRAYRNKLRFRHASLWLHALPERVWHKLSRRL